MDAWIDSLLALLALPQYGLSTVFVVSFLSATLLPLGSEPVVFGLVKLNPAMFWPVILVATVGNSLGGGVSWAMGWASHSVVNKYRQSGPQLRALNWLQRIGPGPACCHGCPVSATHCAPWQAGCACLSGPACSTL
jgi:membrane protein YqaA with SNARE-associated domain